MTLATKATWAKNKFWLVRPQGAQTYNSLLEAKLYNKDLYGNLS